MLPSCADTLQVLTADDGPFTGLAIDGSRVYYASATAGPWSCDRSDCQFNASAIDNGGADGIAIDSSAIYFTSCGADTLKRCPLSGCNGSPEVLTKEPGCPTAIARWQGAVYFVETGSSSAIMRCTSGGCSDGARVFAAGQTSPGSIAADCSGVYWVNGGTPPVGEGGVSTDGQVLYCPISGCPASGPKVIADYQRSPVGIALDASSVYWIAGGRVRTAPKP